MLTPTEDRWITIVTFLRDLRDRWAYITNLYSAHDVDEKWVFDEFRSNIERVTSDLYAYLEGCCVDSGPSGEPTAGSGSDPVCAEGDTGIVSVVDTAGAYLSCDSPGVDEVEERACQDPSARAVLIQDWVPARPYA